MEASQCQNLPTISKISDAVAKQMSHRPKKAEQFQKYSTEWKKIRDAKVDERREQLRAQERVMSQSRNVSAETKKFLPNDYKGPISGYYQQVNRYFEKKNQNQEKNKAQGKNLGTPAINRPRVQEA